MAWDEAVSKLLPREWLLPAISGAVGTGLVHSLAVRSPSVASELETFGDPPWRWLFVFGVLMLLSLGVRVIYRKITVCWQASKRAERKRAATQKAADAESARAEKEKRELREFYRQLRPMDRAILEVFVKTGVKSMAPERICELMRVDYSRNLDGIADAFHRLKDRGVLFLKDEDYFSSAEATLVELHFKRLNSDPSLLSESAAPVVENP